MGHGVSGKSGQQKTSCEQEVMQSIVFWLREHAAAVNYQALSVRFDQVFDIKGGELPFAARAINSERYSTADIVMLKNAAKRRTSGTNETLHYMTKIACPI